MPSPYAPIIVARNAFDGSPAATTFSATVSDDTTNYKTGTKARRVTKNSALGSFAGAEFTALWTAITLQPGDEIKVRIYIPPTSVIDNMQIVICRGGASTAADQAAKASWNLATGQPIPTGWQEFYLSPRPHDNYSHASGGIPGVTGLGFYMYGDTPQNDYFVVDDVQIARRTSTQKAVFIHTSDDGFNDQQDKNMLSVLDKYNFKTTTAVISGSVGTGTAATGYASWTQLKSAAGRGHLPNNHSQNGHDSSTFFNGKSHTARIALMRSGLDAMVANGLNACAGLFTFPLGLGNGTEWTEVQIADLYSYASAFRDTAKRGWPRVPRPVCRVRCNNTLTTGSFTRGDTVAETSGGTATGVTATFSHFGNPSGANTYMYLLLNSTGVPAAASGAVWNNQSRAGTATTNNGVENSSFGLGRTAMPVSPGNIVNGYFPNFPAACWYPEWLYASLADWGPVSTTGTSCIKYDNLDNTVNWTWDNAAKTLTAGSGTPFSAYTRQSGDLIYISGGTGFTPGWYDVATKVSSTQITLGNDPYIGATVNIANTADVKVLSVINDGANWMRAMTRGAIHLAITRNAFCVLLNHRILEDSASYDNVHMKVADFDNTMGYLRAQIDAGNCAYATAAEVLQANGIVPSVPAPRKTAQLIGSVNHP